MRNALNIICGLFFFCLTNNLTLAQDWTGILWGEKQLSWNDFKGTEEDTSLILGMDFVLDYSYEEIVIKWPTRYKYRTKTPVFLGFDSWVADSLKTDCNLKFHQAIFDYIALNCKKATLDCFATLGEDPKIRSRIWSFYLYQALKSKEIKDFIANSNNGTIKDTVDTFYNKVNQEISSISVVDSVKNLNYGHHSLVGFDFFFGFSGQNSLSKNPIVSNTINGVMLGFNMHSKRNTYGLLCDFRNGTSNITMITEESDTLNKNEEISSGYFGLQYERNLIDNKYVSIGPVFSLGFIGHASLDKDKKGATNFFAFRLGASANFHCFDFVNLNRGEVVGNSLRICPYLQYQQKDNYSKMLSFGLELAYVLNYSSFCRLYF